jgi:hypothetical protein
MAETASAVVSPHEIRLREYFLDRHYGPWRVSAVKVIEDGPSRQYHVVVENGYATRAYHDALRTDTSNPNAEAETFVRLDQWLWRELEREPLELPAIAPPRWSSEPIRVSNWITTFDDFMREQVRRVADGFAPRVERHPHPATLSHTNILAWLAEIAGTNTPANALIQELIDRGLPIPAGSYRMTPMTIPPGVVLGDPIVINQHTEEDDNAVKELLDLARANDETGFRALAACYGPAEEVDALWVRVRRRVRR